MLNCKNTITKKNVQNIGGIWQTLSKKRWGTIIMLLFPLDPQENTLLCHVSLWLCFWILDSSAQFWKRTTLHDSRGGLLNKLSWELEQIQVIGRVQGRWGKSGKASGKKRCDPRFSWLVFGTHWVRFCSRFLSNSDGPGTAAWESAWNTHQVFAGWPLWQVHTLAT